MPHALHRGEAVAVRPEKPRRPCAWAGTARTTPRRWRCRSRSRCPAGCSGRSWRRCRYAGLQGRSVCLSEWTDAGDIRSVLRMPAVNKGAARQHAGRRKGNAGEGGVAAPSCGLSVCYSVTTWSTSSPSSSVTVFWMASNCIQRFTVPTMTTAIRHMTMMASEESRYRPLGR